MGHAHWEPALDTSVSLMNLNNGLRLSILFDQHGSEL